MRFKNVLAQAERIETTATTSLHLLSTMTHARKADFKLAANTTF